MKTNNEKFLKEKWAEAKKKLRQFRDDDDDDDDEDMDDQHDEEPMQEPPRKKTKCMKEYGENKSCCSDQKVKFFSEVCLQLQKARRRVGNVPFLGKHI